MTPAAAFGRGPRWSVRVRTGLAALALIAMPSLAPVSAVAPSHAAETAANPEQDRLPPFEGRTLDGRPLATSAFAGKRLILFFFNPGLTPAATYAQAVAKIAPEQTRYNFAVAGVAMGLDPAKARAFASKHKLTFPVFDDTDGDIASKLSLQAPLVLVGVDAEGRAGLAIVGAENQEGPSAVVIEARLREFLRLPQAGAATSGKLETQTKAPAFEAKRIDGGTLRLADLAGKPLILAFFVPSCSHCQDALRFFKNELERYPEDNRPALVGVTGDSRPYAVESALKEKGLDFFPVLLDPGREVATAYGSFGAVPDIVLIDAAGSILFRSSGWEGSHDPDLMRMRLAKLTGRDVPMLVRRDGYSGNDVCSVCHEKEAATWHFTEHSFAFETLVTKAADRDPKCIGCHVVGFGEKGGFSEAVREKHLEDVGCETCHGKGGGHLKTEAKAATRGDYRAACAKCHDPEHSLGFDYATFLPKVSHATIALQSDAERARRIANREQPRDLLPTTSDFVGSEACKTCHAKEFGIWSGSAHARSVESLRKKNKQDDAKCITCHVTGYGRPGGFPKEAKPGAHADLERVGCESCHGPGAAHVKAEGKQPAGILRLGDKCDSCVILQICGSCHDDVNDPGFRFEVEKKIEVIRHGAPPPAGAH